MFSFHEFWRGNLKGTHNNFTPSGREIMLAFSDQTTASFLPLTAGQREIFEIFCLHTSFSHTFDKENFVAADFTAF